MEMLLSVSALVVGLILLVWSSDKFVDGSAAVARILGVPPLLIGIVIVGFGTSAPEMTVSALSAAQGNSGLALGNAYGSNIANIALILGMSAIVAPVAVPRLVLKHELTMLLVVSLMAWWHLADGTFSRADAWVELVIFAVLIGVSIVQGLKRRVTSLPVGAEPDVKPMALGVAVIWIVVGLALLVGSSQLLVWGAVRLATAFGVSDLIIGLTVVAVGTSLPELASSIAAARKGESDIALGNILGSNFFNTLAVVGLAGAIQPITACRDVVWRDIPVMLVLIASIYWFGFNSRGDGRIRRHEGALWVLIYVAYLTLLVMQSI